MSAVFGAIRSAIRGAIRAPLPPIVYEPLEDHPEWHLLQGTTPTSTSWSKGEITITAVNAVDTTFAATELIVADAWLECTVGFTETTATGGVPLALRLVDADNYIGVTSYGGSTYLYQVVLGVLTGIATIAEIPSIGDRLRLYCAGDSAGVTKNDSPWLSGITTYLEAGRGGMLVREQAVGAFTSNYTASSLLQSAVIHMDETGHESAPFVLGAYSTPPYLDGINWLGTSPPSATMTFSSGGSHDNRVTGTWVGKQVTGNGVTGTIQLTPNTWEFTVEFPIGTTETQVRDGFASSQEFTGNFAVVDGWSNKGLGGSSYDLTPLLNNGGITSVIDDVADLSIVYNDGTDRLECAVPILLNPEITILAVYKAEGVSSGAWFRILDSDLGGRCAFDGDVVTNITRLYRSVSIDTSGQFGLNTRQIMGGITGTVDEHWVDDYVSVTGNAGSNTFAWQDVMGDYADAGNCIGDVSEIIIWNFALTRGQLINLQQELKDKWIHGSDWVREEQWLRDAPWIR